MSARRKSMILCLALACIAGCGRSTNQLCEDFSHQCGSQNSIRDCENRAAALEAEARQKQCLQLWDAYIGCVDNLSSLCDAAQGCATARSDLATYCGIHFE